MNLEAVTTNNRMDTRMDDDDGMIPRKVLGCSSNNGNAQDGTCPRHYHPDERAMSESTPLLSLSSPPLQSFVNDDNDESDEKNDEESGLISSSSSSAPSNRRIRIGSGDENNSIIDLNSDNNNNNDQFASKQQHWKSIQSHLKSGDLLIADALEEARRSNNNNDDDEEEESSMSSAILAEEEYDEERSSSLLLQSFTNVLEAFSRRSSTIAASFQSSSSSTSTSKQSKSLFGTLRPVPKPKPKRRQRGHRESVARRRQSKFEEFETGMTFSVNQCLLAIVLYLLFSILIFTFVLEPEWTMIDSAYFAVVTFTTLGYGDITPNVTHKYCLLFICVYAILGVSVLGISIGVLGSNLIHDHTKATKDVDELNKFDAMNLFEGKMTATTSNTTSSDFNTNMSPCSTHLISTGEVKEQHDNRGWFWKQRGETIVRFLFLSPLVVSLGIAFYIGMQSGWDWTSCLYFFVVTGCTIGYGDLTPTTQHQKLVAIVFIPLSVVVVGHYLAYLANTMIEYQSKKFRHQYESKHHELTYEDLILMDVNGDGKVSKLEFYLFMLVAMKKVDYGLIDELDEYFDKLDVDQSGELEKSDLIEAARRRLHCPRRKLELASYKHKLLEQATEARENEKCARPNLAASTLQSFRCGSS